MLCAWQRCRARRTLPTPEFIPAATGPLRARLCHQPGLLAPLGGFGIRQEKLLDSWKMLKREEKTRVLCLEVLSVLRRALTRSSL